MTANEKRAARLTWGCESIYEAKCRDEIAAALDAAERRGEERVLRWLRGFWKDPGSELGKHVVGEYRKARRARGGKRS